MPVRLCLIAVLVACNAAHHGGAPADAVAVAAGDATDAGSGSARGGVYLIDERFDEMATGAVPDAPWTIEASPAGAVAVREVPFAANKSVELAKPDATGTSSLSVAFPPQSGRVVLEAKVMALETAGFKAIPYIYDGAGDAVASIAFQDGMIEAHIGGAITPIEPFAANVWYRVRVVVDTAQSTFDLYVDGVRKERAVALRTPAASVDHVAFYMDAANTGTLFVDNI